jgi:hypothetical protein
LHKTIVLLGVDSESDLEEWRGRLRCRGLRVVEFREPDVGNAMTAAAVGPTGDNRPFRKLRLLD